MTLILVNYEKVGELYGKIDKAVLNSLVDLLVLSEIFTSNNQPVTSLYKEYPDRILAIEKETARCWDDVIKSVVF